MRLQGFILICSLLFFLLPARETMAIGSYAVKDTLYVMTLSGLKLRTSAKLSSGIKSMLPYGSFVIVKKLTTATDSVTEVDGYGISGDWVEVITPSGDGFVFDGYLTSYLPPQITQNDKAGDLMESYISNRYRPISPKMKVKGSNNPKEFNQVFSHDIRWGKRIAPDSSNYGQVMIREITLEEAYLIANVICRTSAGGTEKDYSSDHVLEVKRQGNELMISPKSGKGLAIRILKHEEKGGGGGATIQYREVFAKKEEGQN